MIPGERQVLQSKEVTTIANIEFTHWMLIKGEPISACEKPVTGVKNGNHND